MATKPIPLGPWRGVNNTLDETSPHYLPGDAPAYVRAARNVDFDRDGGVRRRPGRTLVFPLTDGHSLASVGPWLFVSDGGTLHSLDLTTEPPTSHQLASGLANRPFGWTYIGRIAYGCNGVDAVCVDEALNALPWALPPPDEPALVPIPGGLAAGRYLVAIAAHTPDGREHGASPVAEIDLADAGGFALTFPPLHPVTHRVSIYLSDTNGDVLYYHGTADVAMGGVDVVSPSPTTDPAQTLGLSGPPAGAELVTHHQGRVLAMAGAALYWSQPFGHHLFDLANDVQLFPSPGTLLESMATGYYCADESTIYWVSGDQPETWRPKAVLQARVAKGEVLQLPTSAIPALEQPMGIATLFMTDQGLIAGLDGGVIRHLNRGQVAFDEYKHASLAYSENDGIRQILVALNKPTNTTGFAAVDRAECVVTKANQD